MTQISDYGLLSDQHGAALVSRDGSIDWWSPERFDAPSVFTKLLDADAGHFSIRPTDDYETTRRYLPGTMVIETEFTTATGAVRLTDALALGPGERGHDIGLRSPHLLIRRVEPLTGSVELAVDLAPKPEYGAEQPTLTATDAGLTATSASTSLSLSTDVPLRIDGPRAGTRFTPDHAAFFTLRPGDAVTASDAGAMLADTIAAWQSWNDEHQGYTGPYREQVQRSSLVLQALTYRPTRAVVAAATTSLPEELGGELNWDYRYAWVRDGALTLRSLWVAACAEEAVGFFDWIARSSAETDHLDVMFGVDGERELEERELTHLSGYRDSRPVRVGNDAQGQKQLDVLGEVLGGAWLLREQLGELAPEVAEFLRDVADSAATRWREPDAGLWESRDGERHYVPSKVMCWVALDRAVKMAEQLGATDEHVARWSAERDTVHAAVLEQGYDHERGFMGAFGSDHLDAGVLLIPIVGFLPADDERMLRTYDTLQRELGHDDLIQRWTGAGGEGAFLICSYWLIAGIAAAGQVDRAKAMFERVTAHANDLGLMSEEVDLGTGELIGNFPQALSHIGLINTAWAIAEAEGVAAAAASAA